MMRAWFAIPGDIETRTGGYIYDRRVMELLPSCGVDINVLRLPAGFPFPSADDMAQALRLLESVAPSDVILADGLAWGAISPERARNLRAPVVALCHHPLGLEAGLSEAQSRAFIENERRILAASAHVIVTSATTAQTLMQDFGVASQRIAIAEPGTDRRPRASGSRDPLHFLAVGSLVPRKGYEILVQALAMISDAPWRCTIAGSPDRAPAYAEQVRAMIAEQGLQERIHLAGEIGDEALAALYLAADVFVSASHYEGYGMVLAEALAHGLPIVTTTGGAAASTAPDEAAIKIAPADPRALADALRAMVEQPRLREALAAAAWQAADSLPRWEDAAARIAQVLKMVAAQGPGKEMA